MADNNVSRLLNDPAVRSIFEARRKRYVTLSLVIALVYIVVAIGCAFAPDLMQRPVAGDSKVSIGIASMAFIIVIGVACSGYYTWWSNTVRDPIIDRILTSAGGKTSHE